MHFYFVFQNEQKKRKKCLWNDLYTFFNCENQAKLQRTKGKWKKSDKSKKKKLLENSRRKLHIELKWKEPLLFFVHFSPLRSSTSDSRFHYCNVYNISIIVYRLKFYFISIFKLSLMQNRKKFFFTFFISFALSFSFIEAKARRTKYIYTILKATKANCCRKLLAAKTEIHFIFG